MGNREKFFNVFWKNKACQNLFLLSKDELLETTQVDIPDKKRLVYQPNIILSNFDQTHIKHELVEIKNTNQGIDIENQLTDKYEIYQKKVSAFFIKKYSNSIAKLEKDLNSPVKGLLLLRKIFNAFFSKNGEKIFLDILKKYQFIGNHIKSFDELGGKFEVWIKKELRKIVNQENVINFYDTVNLAKKYYTNILFQKLNQSNQHITDALRDIDGFSDLTEVLDLLYDSGIITESENEAFFECTSCVGGTFKGSAYLKIKPKKLKDFTCPVCKNQVSYIIPYKIHDEIFEMLKSKDGMILFAIMDHLSSKKIPYESNVELGNDEIDIVIKNNLNSYLLVETKMFKQAQSFRNLQSKIKKAVSKLAKKRQLFSNKENCEVKESFLVVNLINPTTYTSIGEECSDLLNKNNIKLHTINSFIAQLNNSTQ